MDNIPRAFAGGARRGYSALRVLAWTGERLGTLQCSLSRTDPSPWAPRPAERCSALQMAQPDRAHWGIENGFHLRLDATGGEDRSRVRHPTSVLNLAMIRRAALSLGIRWIQECRHPRQATLQDFYDAMASHHRRKALSLLTSRKASWLPT